MYYRSRCMMMSGMNYIFGPNSGGTDFVFSKAFTHIFLNTPVLPILAVNLDCGGCL